MPHPGNRHANAFFLGLRWADDEDGYAIYKPELRAPVHP